MKELYSRIRSLRKGRAGRIINARIREFERNGRKPIKDIFNELCFCIMTANFNAERSIRIQDEVGSGFLTLPGSRLKKKLKDLGHRFPNTRSCYIIESRKHVNSLGEILKTHGKNELREWLVKNVKGLGYKEASHFLRNIGYKDYAIIDFHIIDVLVENRVIAKPKAKSLTKRRYLEIEEKLAAIADKLEMSLAELDLYLWYIETGKILK